VDCDAVIVGTPIDLGRLVDLGHPVRRASYELRELGTPSLATVLDAHIQKWLIQK
jgi:predicted GTPase